MALTNVDRALLARCLNKEPGAWNDFVDRFLGIIYHVIHYTAHLRSTQLQPEDVEDLAAEVMLQIVANDYAVLRDFRGASSMASYLTVIARRTCIRELTKRAQSKEKSDGRMQESADRSKSIVNLENIEEVQKLLPKLPAREREIVKMFYIERRSYEEISTRLNIPVNSIGPTLSRARKVLREGMERREAVQAARAIRSKEREEAGGS